VALLLPAELGPRRLAGGMGSPSPPSGPSSLGFLASVGAAVLFGPLLRFFDRRGYRVALIPLSALSSLPL